MELGLVVAPSCNDCHGVHDIKRSVDRSSPIHHSNIAKTCGICHVKVEGIYNQSVHGQLLLKGADRAATNASVREAVERLTETRAIKASSLSVDIDPQ